jgi:ribonuclease BN (tRNA processing enzyme)
MALTKKASAKKPRKLEIRAYNVGFGDCFLLTFFYGGAARRNVLIDFGSTSPPPDDKDLLGTANQIAEDCGGKLDAIVATHRHKDHIGGFVTNAKGTASGDIMRKLADAGKALIVQPWTEDPDAPTDFTGKKKGKKAAGAKGKKALAEESTALYLTQLEDMHRFARAVAAETSRIAGRDMDATVGEPMHRAETIGTDREPGDDDVEERRVETVATDIAGTTASRSLVQKLAFIGEDNVKNVKAVTNLLDMGGTHEYLSFGSDTALEEVLPGVKVHVLGPPTIEQYDKVQKQRSTDPDEFWMLRRQQLWRSRREFWQMQAANATQTTRQALSELFPDSAKFRDIPRASRWFVRRLRGARAKQLLELVLVMDEAMNNTSVILLFEVGGKKLLFPGDAQIENWEFALQNPNKARRRAIRALLAEVDVYKVGHHGSRNATPKTLWGLFKKRSTNENNPRRLRTLMSTKGKVHGHIERNTEVPRKTLVAALKAESRFISTAASRKKVVVETIEFR